MKLSTKQLAISALCLTALSFVLLNVATRMMSEGFGTFSQVYLRIGGGFFLALALFHKTINLNKVKHISAKDWLLLCIMGTLGYGIAVIFVTVSVKLTTFLNIAVVSSTVPFFALLYMALFAKKTITPILFGFLVISFLGVYVITTKSFSFVFHSFGMGEMYALLFAAGSGVFVVSRKFISKNLSSTEITLLVMGIAFISSLAAAMLFGEKLNVSGFFHPVSLLGFIFGSLLNISTTQLQNFGFKRLQAVAGAQLLLLENIFAPILGFFLYNEKVLPIELLGAALILVGVFGYYKFSSD